MCLPTPPSWLSCSFTWAIFFFVLARLLHKQGGALGVHQGGVMLVTALCCCMWGRGREGAMVLALLSAGFQSVTPSATHNQTGPL